MGINSSRSKKQRSSWHTRFGFYLIAVGSACGLGSLWRFPYIVGENGGGAFVLLYVLLGMVIGAPLLIAELSLGKLKRQSILRSGHEISAKTGLPLAWVGRMSVFLSLVVFSYYAVISGWVLYFLSQFIFALLRFGAHPVGHIDFLLGHGWLQFALASVHISLVILIISQDVHEGMEKWISYIMPLFLFLVAVLVFRSLSLPSNSQVLRFLFYPDFSKLSLSSLNQAIGHVFFTLSLGFGIMVTFGSYLKSEDHTPTYGFRVTMVDTLVSLIALLLVFPLAFQAYNRPLTDPAMLFEVLPHFFIQMKGGLFFGAIFFACLYLAALNASLGLLEGIVSNAMDYQTEQSRVSAVWISGIGALIISLIPAVMGGYLKIQNLSMGRQGWIERVDSLLINWILPVVALGVSLAWSYGSSEKEKQQTFMNESHLVSSSMYPYWKFSLKYLAPGLIVLGFCLQIIDSIL